MFICIKKRFLGDSTTLYTAIFWNCFLGYPNWNWVRCGTPGHRVITGLTQTKIHNTQFNDSESPINLLAALPCLWTVGGGWSTRREPRQTQGEHARPHLGV